MPQPLQTYYPRCTARLIFRFDEYGAESTLKPAPASTTKNLNGTTVPRSPLTGQPDPSAPPGVTRYVLAPPGGATTVGGPQDQSQSSDGYTYDVTVIPKSAAWSQNGIQQAGTVNLTIKYVDCPIDPRLVRSCGVELYLGCVTEDAFVATNTGSASPQDEVLPATYAGPSGEPRTNLRFQGFVNKWDVSWGDSEPTITIDAQDNSMLLHNQECPPRLSISAALPLDKAVATYLANFVQFAGLSVEYRPSTDTPPILGSVLGETALRPGLGPQPAGGGGGVQKHSVWDLLTDVCGATAHSIRMDGTTLVIQRARSLLGTSVAQRADDPFRPRTVDGVSFSCRRFLYGRNVKTMKVSRDFGKKCVQNVEVRSQGGNGDKTTLIGRFPLPPDRQVYALPGNAQPDQKWTVYSVPGIKDQPTLAKIAQGIYEQMGRQEMGVEIKTHNLGSFGGDNTDPDILDCKTGDTVEVLVNRDDDDVNEMTHMETALTAQQSNAALMVSLGFSQDFANAYARAYVNAGFTTTYRVKTMKVTWSSEGDGGVDITLHTTNYVQVRADKFLPPGQEPSNVSTAGGA
jgi:hypothetical protein